jgi:hypothetical protein
MSTAVGEMLPLAVAVAISPLPVIALILIMMSRRARSNGLAYLLGWLLGLAIAVGIILTLVNLMNVPAGGGPTTFRSLLKLAVGALLVFLGVRQWQRLPKSRQEPSMPHWMASIDTFSPPRAFGLAVLLSSVGNIALIVAAGLAISRSQLSIRQEAGLAAIFIVIGSLLVAGVVFYHFLARKHATRVLDGWRVWLIANNATLTATLLVVVGALLVGKGITGLNLFG